MILDADFTVDLSDTCPHTRGDDPYSRDTYYGGGRLSPYAWG